MALQTIQNSEITLTFSATELSQLEAFATLNGVSVAAFIHNVALEAANITISKQKVENRDAAWMSDIFGESPEIAPASAPTERPVSNSPLEHAEEGTAPKRGVAGEQSQLAKGRGLVWDIRRALGSERIHGLGWTREQLAFVLKLSVVGVRKMEHDGTTPIKSYEARTGLLNLAKTLQNPSPAIAAYIESEEEAVSKLKAK